MDEFKQLVDRLCANRTLRQVARESGVSASTIRYALKAKHGPRLDTVLKLRDYEARLCAGGTT